MTGPEHYREAEHLLASDPLDEGHVAVAQVHATLALAAATADPLAMRSNTDGGGEIDDAWAEALS